MGSSVTLWEETAPVKLPDEQCPGRWAAGEARRPSRLVFHVVTPPELALRLQSLPAMLHMASLMPLQSYSKGS